MEKKHQVYRQLKLAADFTSWISLWCALGIWQTKMRKREKDNEIKSEKKSEYKQAEH